MNHRPVIPEPLTGEKTRRPHANKVAKLQSTSFAVTRFHFHLSYSALSITHQLKLLGSFQFAKFSNFLFANDDLSHFWEVIDCEVRKRLFFLFHEKLNNYLFLNEFLEVKKLTWKI